MGSNGHRLPENVVPRHYGLSIELDFATYTFNGNVCMDIENKSETSFICLNSVDLVFDKDDVFYECENEPLVKCKKLVFSSEFDMVSVHFENSIKPGFGKMRVKYKGILNDKMAGFYRVKYRYPRENGKEPYTAVTQFEACDARRAFPCWDEPAFKATFDITIITDPVYTVLSNMPLKERRTYHANSTLTAFLFETTPIMSTYLVAFVVGDYACLKEDFYNDICIQVYTPIGKENLGEFALDFAKKSLAFYSEYFEIGYPLPKMDLIAVPENPIEAMENFGLIIFNETNMLLDRLNSSTDTTITNAYIVAHEIAHQWFGNLVTMKWWNDLWLNEGFATWAGFLCINPFLKDYNIWTAFVCLRTSEALYLDCLKSTHSIAADVESPALIDEMFDDITYSKGACVIRMLNSYIGEDEFRSGIQDYLNSFKYANATTQDLCTHLSKYSKMPVDEFMHKWITNIGFPVVQVSRVIDKDGNTVILLEQTRFLASGEHSDGGIWPIPIIVSTKSSYPNIVHKYLMQTETAVLNLGHLTTDDDDNWILLNHDFVNFHRTHYSNEMLTSISADLNSLNAIDRMSFLSDSFALAQHGSTSIEMFLNILSLYKHETDGYVWKTILNIVTALYALIMHTEKINEFRKFVIDVCKPMAKSVGWHRIESINDDDVNTLICRETVQYIMALMFDDDTIDESKNLFQLKCTGAAQLPSGLKKAVYTAVLSNDQALEEIFRFYEISETPEERFLILKALSSVRPIGLFEKVLDWSLAKASYEDAVILLGDMARNLGACDRSSCVWKFIKTNWKVIVDRYSDGILIGRLLKPIIECLITKDDENDVKSYFQVNQIHGAEKSIACGLERLSIQQCFLQRLKIQIDNYTF